MRFGIMAVVGMLAAATAGMAHGERDSGKPWSEPNHSLDSPIVLAQATSSGATPVPDFIMKACTETHPTPDDPRSAMRVVDPAGMYQVYLASVGHKVPIGDIKVTLLSGTQHGKLTAEIDNIGMLSYRYDPAPGYIGSDRATFMVEFGGRFTKMILDIKVLVVVDERSPECPDATLIRAKKPAGNKIK